MKQVKQPTIIIRIITSDYIKIEGCFINQFGLIIGIGSAFKGFDALEQAKKWLKHINYCQENGSVETRIIIKGDFTKRSAKRCDLTIALYGNF